MLFFLFILQIKSTKKDFFLHDVLHSSLLNGKSSSFPFGYFTAVKQDFRKQTLVNFNDKRLASSDVSVSLRDGSQDRVRVIRPQSSTLDCAVQQQDAAALVYCSLGAQVNVRSSILGALKGAKEAQREFLILMI